jgi:hypothetical protein
MPIRGPPTRIKPTPDDKRRLDQLEEILRTLQESGAAQPRKSRGAGKLTITHGEESEDDMEGGGFGALLMALRPKAQIKTASLPASRGTTAAKVPSRSFVKVQRRRVASGKMDEDDMEGGRMCGSGVVGGKKARKPNARAAIVREVMMRRKCSLPEASRIVKEEGLYSK